MNTPIGDPSSSWGALTSEFKHNHRKNFHNIHDKYRLLNALKKKKEKQTLGRSKAFHLHSFITNEETSGPKEKKKKKKKSNFTILQRSWHQWVIRVSAWRQWAASELHCLCRYYDIYLPRACVSVWIKEWCWFNGFTPRWRNFFFVVIFRFRL